MTQYARLIEKDIFANIAANGHGSSSIIDLNGAANLSCNLFFTVSSPVGASVTFQASNVGGTDDSNWTDIQAATTITVDGSYLFQDDAPTYRFFRAVKALSSGSVDLEGQVLVLGDASSLPLAFDFEPLISGPITDLLDDVIASGPGAVSATVVSVGGQLAADIATSVILTAASTASNTASTLVKRDSSGNFAAGTITANLTGTASGNPPNSRTISTTAPLTGGGDLSANRTIAISQSSGASDGYLSSTDWTTFNSKVGTSRTISTTAPLTGGGDLSSNRTIAIPVATSIADGYLSSTDFAIFAAKASGTLTSAHILVGNGSNIATDVAVSGDLTLINTGAFTIANSAVTNAKVSASAAIDFSKLAVLASGNILVGSAGGVATSVVMSGDATIIANGTLTIANSAITNAKVSASAAIDFSKLAALTSAHILVGSAGNVATDVAVSGDITISNAGVTAIGANKVTNAMLATIATASFKGRTTAGTGNVEDLSATQATALLNNMVGDSGSGGTKGLVPAPASGDAAAGKFLKADGTWATAGGGSAATPSVSGTVTSYISVIRSGITTITNADTTATETDGFGTYVFSTGNTDRTWTSPAASVSGGRTFVLVKSDTGTGKVTLVMGSGMTLVDPNNFAALYAQGATMTLYCDGSNLFVVQAPINRSSTATTFTFDGTGAGRTSASRTIVYQRIGDWVTVWIPSTTANSGVGSTYFASDTAIAAWARQTSTTFETNQPLSIQQAIPSIGVMLNRAFGAGKFAAVVDANQGTTWTASTAGSGFVAITYTYYVGA